MRFKLFVLILMIVSLFVISNVCASTPANSTTGFGFDESNNKADQNYFIITPEAISVQKDETQLEQQRLSKEAEFNLKKEIKNNYINEMWATYSSTMILILDLVIMFFLIIFVRLLFFILFELLPFGLNKLIDYIEEWIE